MSETQALKAIRYDQTVRALQEMIERSGDDLVAQSKQCAEIFEDSVRRFYGSSVANTLALRAERLATLNDILGMMAR